MRVFVNEFCGHPFQMELSRKLAKMGHQVYHVYFADNDSTPKGETELRPGDSPQPDHRGHPHRARVCPAKHSLLTGASPIWSTAGKWRSVWNGFDPTSSSPPTCRWMRRRSCSRPRSVKARGLFSGSRTSTSSRLDSSCARKSRLLAGPGDGISSASKRSCCGSRMPSFVSRPGFARFRPRLGEFRSRKSAVIGTGRPSMRFCPPRAIIHGRVKTDSATGLFHVLRHTRQ